MKILRYVCIESPFRERNPDKARRNKLYAVACTRDCINRGEIPYASHLFFTQKGILDDRIKKERALGMRAGKNIERAITISSKSENGSYVCSGVYTDLGISPGMKSGIKKAKKLGRDVIYRELGKNWEEKFMEFLESRDWLDLGLF